MSNFVFFKAWGDRPLPYKEAAQRRTNYGWPVGPTLINRRVQ